GELRPRGRREEIVLRRRQGARVDERAPAHADAVRDGDVVEEAELEDARRPHRRAPVPLLEVARAPGEVFFVEAQALLEDQHLVALLGEPERRDAPAEARADDDEVVARGGHAPTLEFRPRGIHEDRALLSGQKRGPWPGETSPRPAGRRCAADS